MAAEPGLEPALEGGAHLEPGPSAVDVGKRAASIRRKATLYSIAGGLGLLAAWAIASQYTKTEFEILPPPWVVAERMWGFIVGDPSRGVEPGTVFINFWDVWNLDPTKKDTLRSRVQLAVDEEKGAYGLSGLRVGAWATQMNPNLTAWPELENALQHLGNDLGT